MEQSFYDKLDETYGAQQRRPPNQEKLERMIQEIEIAGNKQGALTDRERYLLKTYELYSVGGLTRLIKKRESPNDPAIFLVPYEKFFAVIDEAHKEKGHGGRNKMISELSCHVIPVKAIKQYLALCSICLKKKHLPKKGLVFRPIKSKDFNERCQVGT
jgi:hypothetical protein